MPEAADRARHQGYRRVGRWGWLLRNARRAVGAERNPLLRPVDRVRSALALATAAVLVGALLSGVVVGLLALRAEQGLAAKQLASRHQTVAVTVSAAHADPGSAGLSGDSGYASAQAVWTGPDGARRSGTITVPQSTTPAGTRLPIWTDGSGQPASPPTTGAAAATDAALAGIGTVVVTAALGAGVSGYARHRLTRRAVRAWEREWTQVEPTWSGR